MLATDLKAMTPNTHMLDQATLVRIPGTDPGDTTRKKLVIIPGAIPGITPRIDPGKELVEGTRAEVGVMSRTTLRTKEG